MQCEVGISRRGRDKTRTGPKAVDWVFYPACLDTNHAQSSTYGQLEYRALPAALHGNQEL